MRLAIFSLVIVAAPGLLGQSAEPLTAALLSQPGQQPTVLTPQALMLQTQNGWAQQPGSSWRGPLLAQNRPFEFAIPKPQTPPGKMEPIPTQWPNAKFEAIPTRWKNLKVVPADGGGAVTPGNGDAALFVRPGRK